jgi:site-specific recombinase XerD
MKKLPKIITQEEFERIFAAEKNKKFKLAYLLGFEAGLRISEVIGWKDKIKPLNQENIEKLEKEIEELKSKTQEEKINRNVEGITQSE